LYGTNSRDITLYLWLLQPLPRSMRLTTAPGAYSPVTSDFDQLRLRILKQKKMAVRSGWAQNIAFTSTERYVATLLAGTRMLWLEGDNFTC
jgi:hypothetical protein